jgi:hypothetical protein
MVPQSMLERYYADHGPRHGALQVGEVAGQIPVLDRPGRAGRIVGRARPSGWIEVGKGRAVLWSLEVAGEQLGGLWVCHGRRFDSL